MFCKNCGKEIDINSKFCSNCGFKLENDQESLCNNALENATNTTIDTIKEKNESFCYQNQVSKDNTETSEINQEGNDNSPSHTTEAKHNDKAFSIKDWLLNFIKINNNLYCKQCGTFIGKNKVCPNCHTPKKNPFNNYCESCGSVVIDNVCTKSKVCVKSAPLTSIETVLSLIIKVFSVIAILGSIILLISGNISSLFIIGITILVNVFIGKSTQIYKLKHLLVQKKLNPYLIIIAYILIIALIIFSMSIDVENVGMTDDEVAAYELIKEGAYDFKNPSSVRLVSGSVFYDEADGEYSGWFALSATNGYGATTVGYYFIGYLDGEIFVLDLEEHGNSSSISLAKTRDELDVDKINKKLEKAWK